MESGGKCPDGCSHVLSMLLFFTLLPFPCVVKTSAPVTHLPLGIMNFCLYQQFFCTADSFAVTHGELRDTQQQEQRISLRTKVSFAQ